MQPNWTLTFELPSAAASTALGRALAAVLGAGDVLVLTGPLGAGKTTLTRGIGEGLNVRGPVASPTFVLARTHPSLSGGAPLVHVDAYRLADARELDDLDLDFARSVTVIEWGAGLIDSLVDSWLELVLERPGGAVAAESRGSAAHAAGDTAEDDDTDEPRHAQLRGFGPRYPEPIRLEVSDAAGD